MTTQRPRTYDPPRPRTVTVDGARVACWEAGPPDAEPVVLLHGYPADHRCWRHQVPPLSARHRVITPDLLGWGASDRPLHLSFDYDTEVARVGRLLDALDLDSVNLVGHDYGGFLSLGFTQNHPDRVRRLALLNTRAHGTFTRRWYAVFGLLGLLGRNPLLSGPARHLPYAALHRRSLAPLVRAGHLAPASWTATSTGWPRPRAAAGCSTTSATTAPRPAPSCAGGCPASPARRPSSGAARTRT